MGSAANVAYIHLVKREIGKRKLHGIKLLQVATCILSNNIDKIATESTGINMLSAT